LRRAHHLDPDALANGGHAVARFASDGFAHPTVPALRSSVKNAAARPGHDTLKFVMAGLDPAIHLLGKILFEV